MEYGEVKSAVPGCRISLEDFQRLARRRTPNLYPEHRHAYCHRKEVVEDNWGLEAEGHLSTQRRLSLKTLKHSRPRLPMDLTFKETSGIFPSYFDSKC
jgi:hypothetical protein